MNVMQYFRDGTRPMSQRQPSNRRFNWPIFWIGQAWWLIETAHFGWNVTPQSDAEIICDGIAAVILALAWLGRPVNQ